jgi:hypothetical protein
VVVLRKAGAYLLALVAFAWLFAPKRTAREAFRGVPTDVSYTSGDDWQLEVER